MGVATPGARQGRAVLAAFGALLLVLPTLAAGVGAPERSETVLPEPWAGRSFALDGRLYMFGGSDKIRWYDPVTRDIGELQTRLPAGGTAPYVWTGESLLVAESESCAAYVAGQSVCVTPFSWIDLRQDVTTPAGQATDAPDTGIHAMLAQMGWWRSDESGRGCAEGCAYMFARDGRVHVYNPTRQTERSAGQSGMTDFPFGASWMQVGQYGYFFGLDHKLWRYDFAAETA